MGEDQEAESRTRQEQPDEVANKATPTERIDDPVRMYLTQMGEIPLLKRDEEISAGHNNLCWRIVEDGIGDRTNILYEKAQHRQVFDCYFFSGTGEALGRIEPPKRNRNALHV